MAEDLKLQLWGGKMWLYVVSTVLIIYVMKTQSHYIYHEFALLVEFY
jgi:hypothetical protein